MIMARGSAVSSKLLLITSSVGLTVLLALFTSGDAAAVLPSNERQVQLLSWLTGRYLAVSSTDDSIHVDGSMDDGMYSDDQFSSILGY